MDKSEKLNLSVSDEALQRRVPELRQQNVADKFEQANQARVYHNQLLTNAGEAEALANVREALHSDDDRRMSFPNRQLIGSGAVKVDPGQARPDFVFSKMIKGLTDRFVGLEAEIRKRVVAHYPAGSRLSPDGQILYLPDGTTQPNRLFSQAWRLQSGLEGSRLINGLLNVDKESLDFVSEKAKTLCLAMINAGDIDLPYGAESEDHLAGKITARLESRVEMSSSGGKLSDNQKRALSNKARMAAKVKYAKAVEDASLNLDQFLNLVCALFSEEGDVTAWQSLTLWGSDKTTKLIGPNANGLPREIADAPKIRNVLTILSKYLGEEVTDTLKAEVLILQANRNLRSEQIVALNKKIEAWIAKLKPAVADRVKKILGVLVSSAEEFALSAVQHGLNMAELGIQSGGVAASSQPIGESDVADGLSEMHLDAKINGLAAEINTAIHEALAGLAEHILGDIYELQALHLSKALDTANLIGCFNFATSAPRIARNFAVKRMYAETIKAKAGLQLEEVEKLMQDIKQMEAEQSEHPRLKGMYADLNKMRLAMQREILEHSGARTLYVEDVNTGMDIPLNGETIPKLRRIEDVISVLKDARVATEDMLNPKKKRQ